jgi:hypothetical protein
MGVVAARSAGKIDKLSTRRIDETLYIGNVSGLVNNQIINIHPVTLMEKNPAQIMSMIMADPIGQMVGKWVEKKSGISGFQTWAKLEGITSSISSRDMMLLESSKDFRKVRDVGVLKIPGEITNEDTKIAVTGLGMQSINPVSNISFTSGPYTYAAYALYPATGKHIYISPEGRIGIFIAYDYGGIPNAIELYVYSDDGGKTWTWYRIDMSSDNVQDQGSFCADYYGNLHFVWRETINKNDKRIRYRKWTASTQSFGSIQTVSDPTGVLNICPIIQPTPAGNTVEIMWGSTGYASDPKYFQLLIREVKADETLGTLYQLTTDGSLTHRYVYFTFDYDSQGYRHIIAVAKNHPTEQDPGNLWYIRQTAGGWQPKAQINTDVGDVNLVHYMSNIVINRHDEVYITYDIGPFGAIAKNPLYIKQIKNGVIGPRILVEAGDPSPGGTAPLIQVDSADRVCIVYVSNTNPDSYSMRTASRSLSEISSRQIIYILAADQEMSYIQIPWSIPPNIQGVNPNVPLQGMVMMIVEYASATPEKADIQIHHSGNSVFGAPATPTKILTKSYNIRGIASRTKFNAGFNPVI